MLMLPDVVPCRPCAAGVTGVSMGGVHACMAAGLYPGDVACAPCLVPRSAAVAYVDGAMAGVTALGRLASDAQLHVRRHAAHACPVRYQ